MVVWILARLNNDHMTRYDLPNERFSEMDVATILQSVFLGSAFWQKWPTRARFWPILKIPSWADFDLLESIWTYTFVTENKKIPEPIFFSCYIFFLNVIPKIEFFIRTQYWGFEFLWECSLFRCASISWFEVVSKWVSQSVSDWYFLDLQ